MVAVTSGANMNFDRLRLVTELADLGANVGPASSPAPVSTRKSDAITAHSCASQAGML